MRARRQYENPPVLRVIHPRHPHRRPDMLVLPSEPPGVPLTSSLPPSNEVFSHELEFEDVTPASGPNLAGLNLFEDGEGEDSPETRRSWMASLPPPLPDTTEH